MENTTKSYSVPPKEHIKNKDELSFVNRMEEDDRAVFKIPKLLGHAANARSSIELYEPDEKHKYPSVRVTLPKGSMCQGYDVSYYKFYASPSQVKSFTDAAGKESSFYEVSLPLTDKEGNDKTLLLFKDQGHWENPDGSTKEEKGKWINEGRDEVTLTTGALALTAYCRDVMTKNYARKQDHNASLEEMSHEAKEASQQQVAVERPQHEQTLEK